MWATIGRGRSWTGFEEPAQERRLLLGAGPCHAHHGQGKPAGYMSVRTKPTREQVQAAEALYARVKQERSPGARPSVSMPGRAQHQHGTTCARLPHRPHAAPGRLLLPLMLVSLVPGWMAGTTHGPGLANPGWW